MAVLADLHAGSGHVDESRAEAVVRAVNAEAPDLVLVPGDVVESGFSLFRRAVTVDGVGAALAELRAPLGAYAVLGNHDRGRSAGRVTVALRDAGIELLENRAVRLRDDGRGGLWLAGIADARSARPDVERALAGIPDQATVLALTHSPDVFPDVPERVALTVAGHTHGGQLNVPLVRRAILPSDFGLRYAGGHVEEGGRQLFVSRGVGTSTLPLRLLAPPEIDVLTCVPQPGTE